MTMKEQDAACPINCTPSELSTFLPGLEVGCSPHKSDHD
jgi:hypothetical protein